MKQMRTGRSVAGEWRCYSAKEVMKRSGCVRKKCGRKREEIVGRNERERGREKQRDSK